METLTTTLISDYGIIGIVCAALIFLVIYLNKQNQKHMDKNEEKTEKMIKGMEERMEKMELRNIEKDKKMEDDKIKYMESISKLTENMDNITNSIDSMATSVKDTVGIVRVSFDFLQDKILKIEKDIGDIKSITIKKRGE